MARSQKSLSHFLASAISSRDEPLLNKTKDFLAQRLEKLLGNYQTLPERSPVELRQRIETEKATLKWSEQTMAVTGIVERRNQQTDTNRQLLSGIMREQILYPVCESLGLTPATALELLNSFFCEHPEKYYWVHSLEQKIKNCEIQINNTYNQLQQRFNQQQQQQLQYQQQQFQQQYQPNYNNMINQDPMFITLKKNFEQFKAELSKAAEDTNIYVQEFYMSERAFLIQNIKVVIAYSGKYQPMRAIEYVRDKLMQKEMIKNLIACLERNTEWSQEFKGIMADQQRQKCYGYIQKEQLDILEILFTLSLEQDVKIENVEQYFGYLVKTQFQGVLMTNQRYHHVSEAETVNQSKIADLGILTFLAMIRVDMLAQEQQPGVLRNAQNGAGKILDKMKETQLGPQNSIVYQAFLLATKNLVKVPVDFERNVLDQRSVETIDQLLRQSFLFTEPGHDTQGRLDDSSGSSINGEFLKMLKSFMNLIWEPIIIPQGQEAQEIVMFLTLEVLLKNPVILQEVWTQIGDFKSNKSNSFDTVRMFKDLLTNPMVNFPMYTHLLMVLCGKNRSKKLPAKSVFMMISGLFVRGDGSIITSIEKMGPQGTNMIQNLLACYLVLLDQLEQEALQDQEHFNCLNNIVIVICKIIKQCPKLFPRISQELLEVSCNPESDYAFMRMFPFDSDFGQLNPNQSMYEQDQLLILLVRTLYVFACNLSPVASQNGLKHIIDALTSIFECEDLKCHQASIISLISRDQFNSFIQRNCMDYERMKIDYKVSMSYLKFAAQIFQQENPQMLLSKQEQIKLNSSFLDEILRVVYTELISAFPSFKFATVGHFAKFATRLLELTNILIQKFDCGNNSPLKMEISQPNPRFDLFLSMILKYLKKAQLPLIMDTLALEEVPGFAQSYNNLGYSFVQNKYLAKLISMQNNQRKTQPETWSSRSAITRGITLVNDMIQESMQCLTQILRLAVQRELYYTYNAKMQAPQREAKDGKGLKLYYIEQLPFVREIRQQLCEPSVSKSSLIGIMAFYSKAECTGESDCRLAVGTQIKISNNTLALEFMKTSCQLWQTHSPQKRIDLNLFLTRSGFIQQQDLKKIFLIPLISALKELKTKLTRSSGGIYLVNYLNQMFELLTICAQSQHSIIDHLFSQPLALSGLGQEIIKFFDVRGSIIEQCNDPALHSPIKQLASKMVAMLSVMAQERVALPFIKGISGMTKEQTIKGNLVRFIFDSYIKPVCQKATQASELPLNLANESQFKILTIYHHCQSLISLADFLTLVQSLFALDPIKTMDIRIMVEEIFSGSNKFYEIQSTLALKNNLNEVIQNMRYYNDQMKNGSDEQTMDEIEAQQHYKDFQKELQAMIRGESLYNEEQSNCSMFNHKLVSKEISISSLDTFDTFKALKFLEEIIHFNSGLTLNSCSHKVFETNGNLGPEFLISTVELEYLLLNNGYQYADKVNAFVLQAQALNLCMSVLVSMSRLDQAKSNFIMSIGKTKLRENLKNPSSALGHVNGESQINSSVASSQHSKSFQMLASLFPLVDKDFPRVQKSNNDLREVKSSIELLIKKKLAIAKGIFTQLKQERDLDGVNKVNSIRTLYMNFKHSETLFEYLESTLSSINICVSSSALQGICEVDDLQEKDALMDFVSRDLLWNLKEVYTYQMSHLAFDGLRDGQQSKVDILDINHQRLFQQLVLSSFQILESITGDQQFSTEVMRDETEGIIKCVSKIEQMMQVLSENNDGLSNTKENANLLFRQCLRTLQVAIDLLSEDSMRRDQALRIVIQRLVNNKQSDVEETIMILQFLNTYAGPRKGAYHLFAENIFQHLQMNKCIYDQGNFYKNEQARDEHHIVWCHVLLLIRSLSSHLLDDSQVILEYGMHIDSETYLRSLIGFLSSKSIDERIQQLICYCLQPITDQQVTQALLEEIGLTLSIVKQVFMKAEKLNKYYYGVLQGLKDCLVFGLTNLFTQVKISDIVVYSQTEKYLKSQNLSVAGGLSLFDIKAHIQMVKIYMNFSSSLINLIQLDKESISQELLFPPNWQYLHEKLGNTQHFSEFNQTYLFSLYGQQLKSEAEQAGQGALLKLAYKKVVDSQEAFLRIYQTWNANQANTKTLFDNLQQIFGKDDSITKEYHGLNSIFATSETNFSDFMSLFETSLQMGNQLALLLLERLKHSQGGKYGGLSTRNGLTQRDVIEGAHTLHKHLESFEQDVELSMRSGGSSIEKKNKVIQHTKKLKVFTTYLLGKGGVGQPGYGRSATMGSNFGSARRY